MLKPFNIRFRYHFYGSRPTNNIRKVRETSGCFTC